MEGDSPRYTPCHAAEEFVSVDSPLVMNYAMILPAGWRRRVLFVFVIVSTLLAYLYLSLSPSTDHPYASPIITSKSCQIEQSDAAQELPLPAEYEVQATDPEWCESKYSTAYLTDLRDGRQSYCDPTLSNSSLDCFGTNITEERRDIFCLAKGVSMLHTQQSTAFKLDCTTWDSSSADGSAAVLDVQSFPKYMYNTGPYHIYSQYFSTTTKKAPKPLCTQSSSPKYTILLKREGDGNLWHSLLEVFSLYLTIDALRITPLDPSKLPTSESLISAADIPSTQIVILDDHPDGPYFDLWRLFAPLPIVRLKELPFGSEPACLDNVIIPLAGGSNPLWRGDWHAGACTHSPLLDIFSRRVLSQYGYDNLMKSSSYSRDVTSNLTLTFIDRRETRTLRDTPHHLENLQAHFPNVHIQSVDFAAIPFSKQLQIIRETDILVGVHGAGLTHSMFLPEGSSMVEILPHNLNYKGFRNLAKLRRHRYFSAHANFSDEKGDWHDLDVSIDEDRFIEVVGAGIRAMLHRGEIDEDVV